MVTDGKTCAAICQNQTDEINTAESRFVFDTPVSTDQICEAVRNLSSELSSVTRGQLVLSRRGNFWKWSLYRWAGGWAEDITTCLLPIFPIRPLAGLLGTLYAQRQ